MLSSMMRAGFQSASRTRPKQSRKLHTRQIGKRRTDIPLFLRSKEFLELVARNSWFQGNIDTISRKKRSAKANWGILRSKKHFITMIADEPAKYILMPHSPFLLRWDVFLALLVMYSCYIIPFRLAFGVVETRDMRIVQLLIDFFFLVDVGINFLTAFYNEEDVLVQSWRQIASRYARGWLAIDFFSSVPFDVLIAIPSLRVVRLLKMARLAKLHHLFRAMTETHEVNSSYVQLTKLLLQILYMAHVMACLWFSIGKLGDISHTWVFHHGLVDADLYTRYWTALYWSYTTMTAVGYGDVVAVNGIERIFSVLSQLIGASLFGFIIGNVSMIVDRVDAHAAAHRQKMNEIKMYMRDRKLPLELQRRVRRYLEYYYARKSVFDEHSILNELPTSLRSEVVVRTNFAVISEIPLFSAEDEGFVVEVVTRMKPLMLNTGAVAVKRGELCTEMLFLLHGMMEEVCKVDGNEIVGTDSTQPDSNCSASPDRTGSVAASAALLLMAAAVQTRRAESIVAVHVGGGVIGDISVVLGEPSCTTVRCVSSCDTFSISKEDIDVIFHLFSESLDRMTASVSAKKERLGAAISECTRSNAACVPSLLSLTRKNRERARRTSVVFGNKLTTLETVFSSPEFLKKSATSSSQTPGVRGTATALRLIHSSGTRIKPGAPGIPVDAEHKVASGPPLFGSGQSALPGAHHRLGTMGHRVDRVAESLNAMEKTRIPPFILSPSSKGKKVWDSGIGLLIMYSVLLIPYRIGFNQEAEGVLWKFDVVIDIMFVFDMILSFRTGYADSLDDDVIITSPRLIAIRYFRSGWFFIDFFSTAPLDDLFELLLGGSDSEGGTALSSLRVLRVLRLIRLLKLFRLLKLRKVLGKYEESLDLSPAALRLVKLGLQMSFIAHLMCCFWFYVGQFHPRHNWWVNYGLENSSPGQQYVASLYWAFTTMTTVGYGDITALNNIERVYAIASMILGASVFGYVVGSMASLVGRFDMGAVMRKEKMTRITDYMRERRLPRRLRLKIRRFYEFYHCHRSVFDEQRILSDLNDSLRREVVLAGHGDAVGGITFFTALGDEVCAHVVSLLVPVFVMPHDWVFKEGQLGLAMYFLLKGTVEAVVGENQGETQVKFLEEGSFFGEIALLMSIRRPVGVRAITTCQLFSLSKENVDGLALTFPRLADRIKERIEAMLQLPISRTKKQVRLRRVNAMRQLRGLHPLDEHGKHTRDASSALLSVVTGAVSGTKQPPAEEVAPDLPRPDTHGSSGNDERKADAPASVDVAKHDTDEETSELHLDDENLSLLRAAVAQEENDAERTIRQNVAEQEFVDAGVHTYLRHMEETSEQLDHDHTLPRDHSRSHDRKSVSDVSPPQMRSTLQPSNGKCFPSSRPRRGEGTPVSALCQLVDIAFGESLQKSDHAVCAAVERSMRAAAAAGAVTAPVPEDAVFDVSNPLPAIRAPRRFLELCAVPPPRESSHGGSQRTQPTSRYPPKFGSTSSAMGEACGDHADLIATAEKLALEAAVAREKQRAQRLSAVHTVCSGALTNFLSCNGQEGHHVLRLLYEGVRTHLSHVPAVANLPQLQRGPASDLNLGKAVSILLALVLTPSTNGDDGPALRASELAREGEST